LVRDFCISFFIFSNDSCESSQSEEIAELRQQAFTRINPKFPFHTTLTVLHPLSRLLFILPISPLNISLLVRSSNVGHALSYSQDRVLTVREAARSMGFPDVFRFVSLEDREEDMYKQIGNAVPVPLAKALGTMTPNRS
jgi:site-specific DNA-cytosine methylase